MAKYEITAPDGSVYEVTAPDDASEDQVLAYAQSNWKQQAQQAAPAAPQAAPAAPPRQWSDVPGEAGRNLVPSAGRFASGIYEAVRHPFDTVKAAGELAAGATRAGLRTILPAAWEAPGNEDTKRQDEIASAAWQALKRRYGGEEEIRNTIATDPVGVMADLSTVFTGGSTVAPKLATAARMVDPIALAGRAGSGLTKGAVSAVREITGNRAGIGGESLSLAYQAGKEGGEAAKAYRDVVKGNVPGEQVVNDARDAVETLYRNRQADYNAASAGWKGNSAVMDIRPIEQAYQNLVSSTRTGNGFSGIGAADQRILTEIRSAIDEFSAMHPTPTVSDLDFLKRRISAIAPDSPMHTQQSRLINGMTNAVKQEIAKQAPQYAADMKRYQAASDQISEIQKALGLGQKTSTDTALRKLTALTRNNVNTAYGHRLNLARDLAQASGKTILPQLAGLATKEWMPRGMAGANLTLNTAIPALGGFMLHPSLYFTALAESPRIAGNVAFNAGRVAGLPQRLAGAASAVRTPWGTIDLIASGKRLGGRLGLPEAMPTIRRSRQPVLNAAQKLEALAALEEERRRRESK